MKSRRKQKDKISKAPKKCNIATGHTGIQKITSRTSMRNHKAKGFLPPSAAQMLVQQLPSRSEFNTEVKEVSSLDFKGGQLHPYKKIKLQLFPIDTRTRTGLEKDGYNPFLELILSPQKKITSVIMHIKTKWGSSSIAAGELMLFPYSILLESLATNRRWTLNDTGINAGEVHAVLGNPVIFRLRYGWISNTEHKIFEDFSKPTLLGDHLISQGIENCCTAGEVLKYDNEMKIFEAQNVKSNKSISKVEVLDAIATEQVSLVVPVDCMDDEERNDNGPKQSITPWHDSLTNLSIGGLLSEASLQRKIDNCNLKKSIQLNSDISMGDLLSEACLQGTANKSESTSSSSKLCLQPSDKGLAQSLCPWEDSLTSLSIGGLLSEASLQGKINNELKPTANKLDLLQMRSISDSFDAFPVGRTSLHTLTVKQRPQTSHSSILDAEETCDGFPFRKSSSSQNNALPLSGRLNDQYGLTSSPSEEPKMDHLILAQGVGNIDNSIGLTGIKWNDTLGPFDLGLTISRPVAGGDSVSINEFVR